MKICGFMSFVKNNEQQKFYYDLRLGFDLEILFYFIKNVGVYLFFF
jgi:hypothetical protein